MLEESSLKTKGEAAMPAATAIALDEAQLEQLRAIIAKFSSLHRPAPMIVVETHAPSDVEVRKLLQTLRPCGNYSAALCRIRTACLENGHGNILDVVSGMDQVGRALLTKSLPWSHHRRTCSCRACSKRRILDKAIGTFARRLAAEHHGFDLTTAVMSAIRGAEEVAEDCARLTTVMQDLVKIYLEHLALPEERTQLTLDLLLKEEEMKQ